MKSTRDKIYKKMGAEDYVATPELKETFINVIDEDLTHYLEKITQQTLLIWGENDDATPVSQAKIMKEKIKNSKLIVVPNAGHFSFVDKPEIVGKEIFNFIQK